jgi:hypothetical protein
MYKNLTYLAAFLFLNGCASTSKHEHTSGSIVALDSKIEAHVCLTSDGSTLGELIDVYEVVCTKVKAEASSISTRTGVPKYTTTCNKVKRGHARVIENTDKHFSKIRAEENLELKEGFLIETSQTILK